jgi:hypothetical protein
MKQPKVVAFDSHRDAAYVMKEIVEVKPDGRGFLVALPCKHTVWTPIPVKTGQRMYCSACMANLLANVKRTQISGLETLQGGNSHDNTIRTRRRGVGVPARRDTAVER